MTNGPGIDPVLTVKEVATELKCSKSQAGRLLNGKVKGVPPLPSLPLGRKKVVLRSVLERWKQQNGSGMMLRGSEVNAVDAVH